jgi:hypothetical protein
MNASNLNKIKELWNMGVVIRIGNCKKITQVTVNNLNMRERAIGTKIKELGNIWYGHWTR